MPITPTGSFTADGDAAQGGLLHRAAVLIGPGGIGEQAFDSGVHFGLGGFLRPSGHLDNALHKLSVAGIQVFGDEVQDLRAVEAMPHGPARFGGVGRMGRFDRVADVLAVAVADLPDDLAFSSSTGKV